MKKQRSIPFDFILEQLGSLSPAIRPMFGCHAIYVGEKLVLILRLKAPSDVDNGIWVASPAEGVGSLKAQFPTLRAISIFGGKNSTWHNLPYDSVDFEERAFEICELIVKRDPRIGKIPKPKRK